jgi:hypothetical protein
LLRIRGGGRIQCTKREQEAKEDAPEEEAEKNKGITLEASITVLNSPDGSSHDGGVKFVLRDDDEEDGGTVLGAVIVVGPEGAAG